MKNLLISMTLILAALAAQGQSDTQLANKEAKKERKEAKKEMKDQRITLKQLNGEGVNEESKTHFMSDFGNKADVAWTRDLYFDKATFTNDKGTKTSAFYDSDGELVGTSTPSSFESLPATAQTEIKKYYMNYEHAPVIFYDDNESNDTDMILYGVQFDDADNYFIEVTDKKSYPVVLKVTPQGQVTFFSSMPVNK